MQRERDKKSYKQIVTTWGSIDVLLVLFTQGIADGGSSASDLSPALYCSLGC